jgi:hypothetical protein
LDRGFEPFLIKAEHVPQWIPLSIENSIFQSYLSGLVAAEGCIRLYSNHGHTDTALTITLKKRTYWKICRALLEGESMKLNEPLDWLFMEKLPQN